MFRSIGRSLSKKEGQLMKTRKWSIRLITILSLSLVIFLYAYLRGSDILLGFINASFMVGLLLLIISGSSYVIIGGFFKVSLMGWKRLLRRNDDDYIDRTHWSYDKNNGDNDEDVLLKQELRGKAKNELFITLPFIVGAALIAESSIVNYLFLK